MSESLSSIGLTGNYEIGEIGWGKSLNETIEVVDSLLQPVVHSFIDYRPTEAKEGVVYIVARSTTEKDLIPLKDSLVVYTKKSWFFIKPKKAFKIFLLEENKEYTYTGSEWAIEGVYARVGDIQSSITTDKITLANQYEALAKRIDTVQANYKSDIASSVQQTEMAYANQYETVAKIVTDLNSSFLNKMNASIKSESETRSDAVESLSRKLDTLSAQAGEGINASIKREQEARASQFESLVKAINTIKADYGDVSASLVEQVKAVATSDMATVSKIESAKAEIANNISAAISNETQLRASALETVAINISKMGTNFNSKLQEVVTDNNNNLISIKSDITNTAASIDETKKSISDSNTALTEQISTTKSELNSRVDETTKDLEGKIAEAKQVATDSQSSIDTIKKTINDKDQAYTEQIEVAKSSFKQEVDTYRGDSDAKIQKVTDDTSASIDKLGLDFKDKVTVLSKSIIDSNSSIEAVKKTINDNSQASTQQLEEAKSSFKKAVDDVTIVAANNTDSKLKDYDKSVDDRFVVVNKSVVDATSSIESLKKTVNDASKSTTEQISSATSSFQSKVDQVVKDTDGKLGDVAKNINDVSAAADDKIGTVAKNAAANLDKLSDNISGELTLVRKSVVDSNSSIDSLKKTVNDSNTATTQQIDSAKSSFKDSLDTVVINTGKDIKNLSDSTNDKFVTVTKSISDSNASIDNLRKTVNDNKQSSTDQLDVAKSDFSKEVKSYKVDTDGKIDAVNNTIVNTNSDLQTFKNTYNDDNKSRAEQTLTLTANLQKNIKDTKADTINETQSWAKQQFLTENQVNSAVSGKIESYDASLVVGVKNRQRNSDFYNNNADWWYSNGGFISVQDDREFGKCCVIKGQGNDGLFTAPPEGWKNGETYTASIYIKDSTCGVTFGSEWSTTIRGANSVAVETTGVWRRYWFTFTKTNTSGAIVIYLAGTGQTTIGRFKLELGTKLTDWSPAPEDVQTQLNANSSATSSLKATVDRQGNDIDIQSKNTLDLRSNYNTDQGNLIKNASLVYSDTGWVGVSRVDRSSAPSGMPLDYGLRLGSRDSLFVTNTDRSGNYNTAIPVAGGSKLYLELYARNQDNSRKTIGFTAGAQVYRSDGSVYWLAFISISPDQATSWTRFTTVYDLPGDVSKIIPWFSIPSWSDFDGNNWYFCNPVMKVINETSDLYRSNNATAELVKTESARITKTEQGIQAITQANTQLNSKIDNTQSSLSDNYLTSAKTNEAITNKINTFSSGLTIGASNRLPDSELMSSWAQNACSVKVVSNSESYKFFGSNSVLQVTDTAGGGAGRGVWFGITSIPDGSPITLSVWVYGRGSALGTSAQLGLETMNITSQDTLIVSGWKRLWVKGTWRSNTGNNACILYFYLSNNDYLFIARSQLEVGSILSDWNPSINDVTGKIQNTEAYIQRTAETVSNLDQTYTNNRQTDLARVGATESVISRLDSTYVKPGDVGSLVSTNMSTITGTEVKKQLDTLVIGGTNLLPYTKFFYGWSNTENTSIEDAGFKDFAVSKSTSQFSYHYTDLALEAGQVYTISAMVKSDRQGSLIDYFTYNSGGDGAYRIKQANTWEQYSCTFIAPNSNVARQRLESTNEGGATVSIAAIKLERGNKKTDWSPNDGDILIGGENLVSKSEEERTLENSSGNENYIWIATPMLEPNTYYCLSADIKSTGPISSSELFYIDWSSQPMQAKSLLLNPTGDYKRYSFRFRTGSSVSSNNTIRIDNNGSTNGQIAKLFVSRVKLEKGLAPTDWSISSLELSNKVNTMTSSSINLVRNSNFRDKNLNWWGLNGGYASFGQSHLGGNYCKIVSTGGADGLYAGIYGDWELNATYTLTAVIRNISGGPVEVGIEGFSMKSFLVPAGTTETALRLTGIKTSPGGAFIAYSQTNGASFELHTVCITKSNTASQWSLCPFDVAEMESNPTNLFSKRNTVPGWLDQGGNVNIDSDNITSRDYVSCKEGNYITFTMYDDIKTGPNYWASSVVFYDSSKNKILYTVVGWKSAIVTTIQAPKNAAWFRVSVPKTTEPVRMKVELGRVSTAWSVAAGDAAAGDSLDNYAAKLSTDYYTKDQTDGNIRSISAGKIEQYSVGLTAGGTNKLENSDFTFGTSNWNGNGARLEVVNDSNVTAYNGAKKSCAVYPSGGWIQGPYRWVNTIPIGSDVTLSVWIFADGGGGDGQPVGLSLFLGQEVINTTWTSDSTIDEKGNINIVPLRLKAGWNKYLVRGIWRNNGNVTLYTQFSSGSQKIYMSRPMLSVGKLFPDWSTAPSDIDQTTGNLATAVSNTYTRQETDGKIDTVISGKKEEFMSSVKVVADATNALSTTVNNLQVGGTNLFTLCQTVSGFINGGGGISQGSGDVTSDFLYVPNIPQITIQIFDTSILSGNTCIGFYDGNKNFISRAGGEGSANFEGSDIKKLTISVVSGTRYIRVSFNALGNTKPRVKVEKGNRGTDWSPAPGDISNSIDTLQTGGRNLILDSDKSASPVSLVSPSSSFYSYGLGVSSEFKSKTVKSGTKLFVSVWYKSKGFGPGKPFTSIVVGAGATGDGWGARLSASQGAITPVGDMYRWTGSYVFAENDYLFKPGDMILIFEDNSSTTGMDLYKIKAELGSMPSEWTPSPEDVSTNVSTSINNIKIGGTNLYKKSTPVFNIYQTRYVNKIDDGVGFEAYGRVENDAAIRIANVAPDAGYYTISFDHYMNSGPFTLNIDINDESNMPLTVQSGWSKCSVSFKTSRSWSSSWIDINGLTGQPHIFKNIKVEKGNKPTDWSPAPEDVDGKITTLSTKINLVAETTNGVSSQYGINVNNNGVMSGFSLYSDMIKGVVNSSFGVKADSFYVGDPRDGKRVFKIDNGVTTIDTAIIPNLKVGSLSTLADKLGSFSESTRSGRLEISGTQIKVYDNNEVLRVRLGLW